MASTIWRVVTGRNDQTQAIIKDDVILNGVPVDGAAAAFIKVWTTDNVSIDWR